MNDSPPPPPSKAAPAIPSGYSPNPFEGEPASPQAPDQPRKSRGSLGAITPMNLAPVASNNEVDSTSKMLSVLTLSDWQTKFKNAWTHLLKDESKREVEVSRPEILGQGMSKYVAYKCTTAPFNYEVFRRYSDFEWLRDILCRRYPGLLLPALPPKEIAVGSKDTDSTFVKIRMFQLQVIYHTYTLLSSFLCFISFRYSWRNWITIPFSVETLAWMHSSQSRKKATSRNVNSSGQIAMVQIRSGLNFSLYPFSLPSYSWLSPCGHHNRTSRTSTSFLGADNT